MKVVELANSKIKKAKYKGYFSGVPWNIEITSSDTSLTIPREYSFRWNIILNIVKPYK